ncbi:uncharacterized protein LOC128491556 [Spea bombifrons]|uniref:uncharacterized protein LOC128491556 n=1 Tax=Spea bombifrons TaxID=233779 RepID=UPI00234AC6BA|nr:uncharacterized protein LOC128491556 [Spea bombifrons]
MTTSVDPECPGDSRRRHRCLDYCLVVSLVLLTLAVGLMCAFYFAWEKPRLGHQWKELTDHQRNNAHLVTEKTLLGNTTLECDLDGVGNVFVGSNFKCISKKLQVGQSGLYYVYSQMVLKCVDRSACKQNGSASITVLRNGDKGSPLLTLSVQISESAKTIFPSSFSGSLKHLSKGDRLSTHLWTDRPHDDWQLDQKDNNFFGLFWVSDFNSVQIHE